MTIKEFEAKIIVALKPQMQSLIEGEKGKKLSEAIGNLLFFTDGPTRANIKHTQFEYY